MGGRQACLGWRGLRNGLLSRIASSVDASALTSAPARETTQSRVLELEGSDGRGGQADRSALVRRLTYYLLNRSTRHHEKTLSSPLAGGGGMARTRNPPGDGAGAGAGEAARSTAVVGVDARGGAGGAVGGGSSSSRGRCFRGDASFSATASADPSSLT